MLGDDGVVDSALGQLVSYAQSVVAPMEQQRPDLADQSPLGDHIESGCEEVDIVDIGSADTPAKGCGSFREAGYSSTLATASLTYGSTLSGDPESW